MCGISIFLSKTNENIIPLILDSLSAIQNRGYDSVGVAFIYKNIWEIIKFASINDKDSLDILIENMQNKSSHIAIGHTRWATHGARTDANSHPHISSNKKIILIHNGIIANYLYLKNFLVEKGKNFNTETDSEVIANLIEYYIESEHLNTKFAIKKSIEILDGTWALGIINTEELDNLYITRKGSPLLLGEGENHIICSSEISGFIGQINNYISLDNNDILQINKYGYRTECKYEIKQCTNMMLPTSCDPYDHWTIKEIMEQPISINSTLNNGARIYNNKVILNGLNVLHRILENKKINNIISIGCGTSYHACMMLKYYLGKNTTISSVQSFDASDFSELDVPRAGVTLCIVCSQSGETRDLVDCIKICREKNCIIIGVINVVDSMISKLVDCGIYLNIGVEKAVASTKSFTSMLVALSLISLWLNYIHNSHLIINELRSIPSEINKLLNSSNIKSSVDNLVGYIIRENIQSIFILGAGKLFPIAKEGALKIKEITYIHTEAYCAGSLKHGPFALLDKTNLTILLLNKKDKLLSTYNEIVVRDTHCFIISDIDCNIEENIILINSVKYYNEIIYTVILQYIAYNLSIKKNINPDKPRNLAKVVTVE